MGVAESDIDKYLECDPEAPEEFAVLPENWGTVELFMRLQSQWNLSPMGERTGLNYQAAAMVMAVLNITDTAAALRRLQIMEYAVLEGSDAGE